MKCVKVLIFLALLVVTNLFLFKTGLWTFQDASYWPISDRDAVTFFSQQFHTFTNYGHYLGFELGLFAYTRILFMTIIYVLHGLFGYDWSQAMFSAVGMVASFVSVYLFLGLFFKKDTFRYVLALGYTFNPLVYQLQGHTLYSAAVPLFIYSFHKFFFQTKRTNFFFLLLNILACFIWIAYIRFVQGFSIVIIPYVIYLFIHNHKSFSFKRLAIYLFVFIGSFSPILYSVFSSLLEKSQIAFNYKNVYGNTVAVESFITAFNLFSSFTVDLYSNPIFVITGLFLFVVFVGGIRRLLMTRPTSLFWLNLFIFIFSLSLFGLGIIFPKEIYHSVIRFFPFISNNPTFAIYVIHLPFTVLLGLISIKNTKIVSMLIGGYIFLGLLPLLKFNNFLLRQLDISDIPSAYNSLFPNNSLSLPNATYYFGNACWRAMYMEDLQVPTPCLNYGRSFSSIVLTDPRLASGQALHFSQDLSKENNTFDKLRVSHNLKDIIIPLDLDENVSTTERDILRKTLSSDSEVNNRGNSHFDRFEYIDSDQYDFFIYSPQSIVSETEFSDNSLSGDLLTNSVVLHERDLSIKKEVLQTPHITYKYSVDNPEVYLVKVELDNNHDSFIIQFNQAYSPKWSLQQIDRESYEAILCNNTPLNYPLTNNSNCNYQSAIFDSKILSLTRSVQSASPPLNTNILSNGWLVSKDHITTNYGNENNLYYAIVYTKQIPYSIFVIVSIGSLGILVLAASIQKIYELFNKNN